MEILLKNGKIYDGTGADAFTGDVLIKDERIAAVGRGISAPEAQVIDLGSLSVAPGFIDAHSHNDWYAVKNEPLKYFEPFVRQGITSLVAGNCGMSAMVYPESCTYLDKIGAGLFFLSDARKSLNTVEKYFEALDNNMPCNLASLVGHGSVRAGIAGYENRPLTADEMTRLLETLENALREGACGISLGLMYEPGIYAPYEELVEVARLCKKYDRPMTVHPRANSSVSMSYPELLGRSHLLRALDELAQIARETGVKLHYSHAIFVGTRSFRCKDEVLSILHGLRNDGIDACFDIYMEMEGVSVITVIMPPWYQALSPEEKRKPFNKLKFHALCTASKMLLGFGYDDIMIASAGSGNERYEGKTVHQIAKELGKSDFNTYIELCEASDFKGRVIMRKYSTPEIISQLSRDEHVLYMTDSWVEEGGVQNPAIYDCFPKFLQASLKGSGDTMPNTVRKMSGATADRFGLKDRGYLRQGMFADVTVFDETELLRAKPDQSNSFGISRVFINGKAVLADEKLDNEAFRSAGKAMKV